MKSRRFMGFRFFGFAVQMLRRDFHAGELRLLVAALVVSVAAMTAVGFFTDRVRQALAREANQLLGADLLLISDHPWSGATRAVIASSGLQMAETQTFPSMVMAGRREGGGRAQLTEIKAVSSVYPLRGRLRTAPGVHLADAPAEGTPARGTAWIDERLASALSVSVGEPIDVGERQLMVAAILTFEPDRGVNFFSVAPRVLISLDDLEATGLVQQGSRVNYRLLVAGEESRVKALRGLVGADLGRGERIEDAENARPEIRVALERAQKFLGIAAMLSVVLAAVAIALASRRYVQRHLDPCAVMRCLGATQSFLLGIYVTQFALIASVSTAVGCLIGFAAHFVLHAGLAHLLATALPLPGAMPALQGVLVGFVLLFGFSLPPVWQLKRVSTLRVLRREFIERGLPPGRLLAGYAAGFLGLTGLIVWMAGDRVLGLTIVFGFVGAMLVFALVARVSVFLLSRMRGGSAGRVGWRFGLASLERHALASVVQIVALALGLMALFLLTAIRGDLLAAWQRAVPVDAPNRFVINIQPEQLQGVRELFARHRLEPEFSPMIRGRLAGINGAPISPENYGDERAKRLVDREFNLSYQADLPAGNRITAGRWFDRHDSGRGLASVEEGLAKTLGLKVGDRLEFTIAGEHVEVMVVGLRKLNWDSMRVNFFVLTPPKVLDDFPTSWITSFYLPPDRSETVNALVAEYPNLTVIDVAAIVRQLQAIIDQVAQAVQFVFLFALLAGVIVLYAALASAAQERRYELAVMRALGARRVQLRRAMSTEFAVIGGLAGLIGALGAVIVGQVLALRAFQLEVLVAYWLIPVGVVVGGLLVTGVGWLAVTRLTSAPPLATLRAGG
ncbi:ABC transporter permease [Propionivibrio dicarboxylicus]|uniref:Putative ABC transport system permease protein n=1 Tax=Propionivibrio dicarboxylicus TaxID=83767 RepID=A0A1G8MLW4_9RHOO|nr:FtsX-like permease family protein [Propionivibrio dicarboxylicus]SDI68836.1 putative ABC transport system permease protein [Propionivibrio dicarboxylicus]